MILHILVLVDQNKITKLGKRNQFNLSDKTRKNLLLDGPMRPDR